MGLEADAATLSLDVSETRVLGGSGTVSLTIRFEDSADGVLWSQLGSDEVISAPEGAYRVNADRPFGAWLRIRLDVDASGTGTLGLADVQGLLTLRRVQARTPLADNPELAPFTGAISKEMDSDCPCGCGGTCGCGSEEKGTLAALPRSLPYASPTESPNNTGTGCGCD